MPAKMDNCCGCDAGASHVHAAVTAIMFWPGWDPFTTLGPSSDMFGVRYLTLTCTVLNDVGSAVTKSISIDGLNRTLDDTVTGVEAAGDGFVISGAGMQLPPWPPDHVTDTSAEWDGGWSIVLSNPKTLAEIQSDCQDLLDSLALSALTRGTDSKIVTYDPSVPSLTDQWLGLAVFPGGAETFPGSGVYPNRYGWYEAASGLMLTVSGGGFGTPFTFTPFVHETPTIAVETDTADAPPSPWAMNAYQQSSRWVMRKSVSSPVSASVCCETDYFEYLTTGAPSNSCAMVANSGSDLVLNRPALTAEVTDNSRIIVVRPFFGTALTGGGCPCA